MGHADTLKSQSPPGVQHRRTVIAGPEAFVFQMIIFEKPVVKQSVVIDELIDGFFFALPVAAETADETARLQLRQRRAEGAAGNLMRQSPTDRFPGKTSAGGSQSGDDLGMQRGKSEER